MTSDSRGYSLRAYGEMIADRVRMHAYEAALRKAVFPGATVMDLGAGTAIMSLIACKFGAARVYAVEPGAALYVGREIVRANGFEDRVEFIHRRSTEIDGLAQVDVIVSDLRATLPLHGQHLPSIIDARRRFLAPAGILIPRSDVIYAQLVSDRDAFDEALRIWREGCMGLDLTPALRWVTNYARKQDLSGSRLVGSPQVIATLDYRTVKSSDVGGELCTVVQDQVEVHGFAAWFDTNLIEGVEISNAPRRPRAIYGQVFFPFSEALLLVRGDSVRVAISARLMKGHDYVWIWETTVHAADGKRRAMFRQSSFEAEPLGLPGQKPSQPAP